MGVTFDVHITGVDKTIRTLKRIDVDVYNETITTIKSAMSKAETSAKVKFPPSNTLSGWVSKKGSGTFPHYNQRQAVAGVKAVVNKKTGKSRKSYKIAALVQKNAGAVIFDMAGSKTAGNGRAGKQFIGLLTELSGKASRIMWPAVRQHQTAITETVVQAATKAERLVNAELGKN